MAKITQGALDWYLITPSILISVHFIGDMFQQWNIGPEWVQGHLHDVGVATIPSLGSVSIIVFVSWDRQFPKGDLEQAADCAVGMFLKLVLPGHAIVTLLCILYKVSQVTILRAHSLAVGYSGRLDVGDIFAFLVGFAIMVANHSALHNVTQRRRKKFR